MFRRTPEKFGKFSRAEHPRETSCFRAQRSALTCGTPAKQTKKKMKNLKNTFQSLFCATALALALGTAAQAQETPAAEPVDNARSGLLGQVYGGLSYSYLDLHGSPRDADNYRFEINHPLADGFDGFLTYDYAQSGVVGGSRVKQNVVGGGVRAFSPRYGWGKPYVEVGAGYAWTKYAGIEDNSFYWSAGVGAEFAVAPRTTLTPYAQYVNAPDLADEDTVNYGVKANYWVTEQWSVMAGIERDTDKNTAFTVGTNFRF